MNCPNCGTPLENTFRCPQCQCEDKLLRRIIRASNYHYNQGLYKARIRDLSGAVTSLQMSLKYNKRNTNARNLLGLVYFQMGEIVEALGEWVISMHFQNKGNIAKNYIKKIQNNQEKLEVINSTIQNYNEAVQYARSGKVDLAINELKKAVHSNANYIRAYQLLGLLYMQKKQYSAAKKVLAKALKLDRNNTTTVRYLAELGDVSHYRRKDKEEEAKRSTFVQIKDPTPIIIERTTNSYTDFNTSTLSFVNILIGIIMGAAVVGLLLVPSIRKTKTTEYNEAIVEYSSQISERNKEIASLKLEIESLTAENERMASEMEGAASVADSGLMETLLIQAMKAYLDNDFLDAGNLLTQITREALVEPDSQAVYDYLIAKTGDSVINRFYAEAYEYYKNKDYMNAVGYFDKILKLDASEVEARYQMGRCYQYLTDFEKARQCYTYIIDNHSDSNYYEDAQQHLNEMNSATSQDE